MRLDPVGSDSRLTRSPLHSAHHRTRDALLVTCFLLLAPALDSCSIRRMAAKSFADALTSGPDVFGRDDDPELIRDALPFGLKTLESLLEILPDHRGLLLASCRGYTQYAYAFVQADADLIEARDPARASELRERALHLYLRARGFGLRHNTRSIDAARSVGTLRHSTICNHRTRYYLVLRDRHGRPEAGRAGFSGVSGP